MQLKRASRERKENYLYTFLCVIKNGSEKCGIFRIFKDFGSLKKVKQVNIKKITLLQVQLCYRDFFFFTFLNTQDTLGDSKW